MAPKTCKSALSHWLCSSSKNSSTGTPKARWVWKGTLFYSSWVWGGAGRYGPSPSHPWALQSWTWTQELFFNSSYKIRLTSLQHRREQVSFYKGIFNLLNSESPPRLLPGVIKQRTSSTLTNSFVRQHKPWFFFGHCSIPQQGLKRKEPDRSCNLKENSTLSLRVLLPKYIADDQR